MKTWEEIKKELEEARKHYTEKQFIEFVATWVASAYAGQEIALKE